MPARSTKRDLARTSINGDYDAIVCGASFAGLATARELAGARLPGGRAARVLLLDRYEVGERQTSACATPTAWLDVLGLRGSALQEFGTLVTHSDHATARVELPWTFSTFDYPRLCSLLGEHNDAEFEIATVTGRAGAGAPPEGAPITVTTDRGDLSAPLVVDALGWRHVLGTDPHQPPGAPLTRGLEVHPAGSGDELEVWIDRRLIPAGYGWSFPAADEVRIGVASFNPEHHVRKPTERLTQELRRPPAGFQGNWIPHELRDAVDGGVFSAGDSAGHCLPLTAEGIRTAFYFGIACGRELRRVLEGRATRETALRRYRRFNAQHERQFDLLLRGQRFVPQVGPRSLAAGVRAIARPRIATWAFRHYLNVAHPSYAAGATLRREPPARSRRSAQRPPEAVSA